jgi:hypothetical protein
MEDSRTVQNLLTKNCYMAKIDLQDAYYSVPIDKEHRKYLRFKFFGILYEFTCLPFGLSTSPRIYTKILRPVFAKLRSMGFCSVTYLDDILLLGLSSSYCAKHKMHTTIA